VEKARRDAGVSDAAGVDVIRAVNDAVANGEPRSVAEHMHPDIVWEHNIGMGSPEEGVYSGRESVIALLERIVETWEWIRPEPRSIDRLEDGRYRVIGDLRAKHRTSDTEIGAAYEQHLEVRDGKMVKGWMKTGEISFP
jgi:ketosteroid isomerase-like protein